MLFILDIKAPTHGALTVAGVASFIVGALVLFNSPNVPSFQRVSVPLVVGTGVVFGLAFSTILTFALRAQRIPVRIGQESLVRQAGHCAQRPEPGRLGPAGQRAVDGGAGRRRQSPKGSRVEVVRVEGIQLVVKRNQPLRHEEDKDTKGN